MLTHLIAAAIGGAISGFIVFLWRNTAVLSARQSLQTTSDQYEQRLYVWSDEGFPKNEQGEIVWDDQVGEASQNQQSK